MPNDDDSQSINVDSITTRVVKRIAIMEGVDPLELQPPLYSIIDIDAVEGLFASAADDRPEGTISVEFEYQGYQVTIESDDEVYVRVKQTDGSN
ncbi:hypothetical protein HWV07_03805 [Natronomonas salina]|uniref:HalOD1 output domain-containing protein n=1 Tax=Natronomonas salina TaxID=1710540 RepID=UPI0015B4B875|nr:HalOD1 output domain-containing protein [Natronomonas salina]QLD88204.1 hypothetical protein HWV07_03805 [Natronomonas salina]